MATTVTIKGQVTIPKRVREAAGIKPGDRVEVRAGAAGTVTIEKPNAAGDYARTLRRVTKRRLIRDMTTDEILRRTRGDPAEDPPGDRK